MAASNVTPLPSGDGKRKRGRPRKAQAANTGSEQAKQPPKLDESERETLVFLRDTLKGEIKVQKGQALASLVRQFRDVDASIRALDAAAAKAAEEQKHEADDDWDDDEI